MIVLGIETSCDETAAAIVQDGKKILSNIVASSVDLHAAYGGVVPEIAARSHIESIIPVIEEAFKVAKVDWRQIDAIGVTYGPGLLGSLLIGVVTANTLAIAKNKPLYAVDHVEAHVYASFLTKTGSHQPSVLSQQSNHSGLATDDLRLSTLAPEFPILALIISGGHTQLVLFKNHFDYQVLGRTGDDAIGEAFDKVAKMLGLPYPGGPAIGEAAKKGDKTALRLPTAKMHSPYDFSFSGLKTAVLRASQQLAGKDYTLPSSQLPELLVPQQKASIAASFQEAALSTVISTLNKAADEFRPVSLVVAGGVAASPRLRELLGKEVKIPLFIPEPSLCTDNGAMIAANAYFQASFNRPPADPYKLEPNPSLSM